MEFEGEKGLPGQIQPGWTFFSPVPGEGAINLRSLLRELHAPPAEHDENKIENRFLKTGESILFEEFIQKYLKHLSKEPVITIKKRAKTSMTKYLLTVTLRKEGEGYG
jgi:hypothetical protein